MLILAVDTSGKNGSLALVQSEKERFRTVEIVALEGGTFSAQLIPQIADSLKKHKLAKEDLDAFAVVSGPGSFTGLRVGLAAIKALAEILQKPIVPVSLLEVVATASRAQNKVVAVMDGGRGEVFFGAYQIAGESIPVLQEELLSKADFLSASLDSTVATPDLTLAAAARDAGLSVVSVEAPTAAMIARFGWKKLQAGGIVSPELLEANYMRRSDAEIFVKKSF